VGRPEGDATTQAAIRRAFSEAVDPAGYVPRAATEGLLAELLEFIGREGSGSTIAACVAPPGSGKTQWLRVLEARLAVGERERRALYLPYGALSIVELCDWVHGLLGRPRRGDALSAEAEADALKALCELGVGPERPFVLLIDDADSMPPATVRAFAAGLARERSALRLVLALTDDSRATRLLAALDRLRPFESRLAAPLDAEETEAYLRARLARAGLDPALLDDLDAVTVARIHALSGGIPRRIHRVVSALLEPERAALARALALHPRTDAWLGLPLDDDR